MDKITETLNSLNTISITARLLMSLLFGGILGVERGRKRRPAGFRTYMLVCMGSALVMITSQYIFNKYGMGDITRMSSQVISGIGFLGAGTIMITGRNQVKGLTTAAGIWAVACLGLAIGIGFYSGATIAFILTLFVMTVLHNVDSYIMSKSNILNLIICFTDNNGLSCLIDVAKENNILLSDIEISTNSSTNDGLNVILSAKARHNTSHEKLIQILSTASGVKHISEY